MHYKLAAVLATALTAAILIIFGAARAEVSPVICPNSEAYCVSAYVHSSTDPEDANGLASRYVLTNETTQTLTIREYLYDITGTVVFSRERFLPEQPLIEYIDHRLVPGTYTGTLVVTASGQFTTQIIDPDPPTIECPNNQIVGRCDFSVFLTVGATKYTLYNPDSMPISQTHDVYRDGIFVARQLHQLPGFAKITYEVPTPASAPTSAARAETTPAPARYNVIVKPLKTETPVTPTPKPDKRENYAPLVTGQR